MTVADREDRVHAITIAVAGIACRLVCHYPKPIVWATELYPEFVTPAAPDVTVTITYDFRYWERGLPWIGEDLVSDAAAVAGDDAMVEITSAYYRARVTGGGSRVDVDMASGFRVDGLMRALYTLLALDRDGLLIRAECVESKDGAQLIVPAAPPPGAVLESSLVAVVARDDRFIVHPTPFRPPTTAPRPRAPRMLSVVALPGPGPLSAGRALARLSPHLCVVDRRPAALGRMLDVATRMLATVDVVATAARGAAVITAGSADA